MKKIQQIFVFVILLKSIGFAQITVACAPNVQFAMEEIKVAFEKSTRTKAKMIYSASGTLAAQIKNGAPYDVFVSADTDFPDSLAKHGAAVGKPVIYAYGSVVLWTMKNYDLTKGLSILTSPAIGTIGIPDPKNAPYGRAALKALQNAGLADTTRTRLVFGESIAQTAQYIITQTVDIGFNAKGIVLSKAMTDKGHWIAVDSTLCPKIAQAVIVCKYGFQKNPDSAKQFLEFLVSQFSKDVLKKNGYDVP